MVSLAMNCLCSSLVAGIDPSFCVWIALDSSAFATMSPFKSDLLLFDIPSWQFNLSNHQRFKDSIRYYVFAIGVDLVWADDDISHLSGTQESYSNLVLTRKFRLIG
jgi:hypothetical protein